MRIKTAAVYPPATPLRAVLLFVSENGSVRRDDLAVVGVLAEVRERGTAKEPDDVCAFAVLVCDGNNRVRTVADLEHEAVCKVVVGAASAPADSWDRALATANEQLWRRWDATRRPAN